MAEQIALVAAPLAAVTLLGAGATETALLQLAQTLPFLVLSIPFGLIIDRSSPKRVLVASESLRTATLAGTVILIATDSLTLEALVCLGLIGAIGTVGVSVAIPSSVPQLVARQRLIDANQWLELGRSVAFVCGPVIAGAIVSLAGAAPTFVIAAVICAAAVTLLLRVDIPRSVSARTKVWADVGRSVRFVMTHDLLRPIIVTSMVFNIGWFLIQSVFVVYAIDMLGMAPSTVGIAMGVYGAGMVIGAFVSRRLSQRLDLGRMLLLGPVGGFLAAGLMVATLWMPLPALAFVSFFLFGLGPVLWSISTTALRQAVTPIAMIGRVSSLLVVSTYGARPIGAAAGAAVAASFGMQWCIALAAAVFAAQLAVVLASALPAVRALPALETADAA